MSCMLDTNRGTNHRCCCHTCHLQLLCLYIQLGNMNSCSCCTCEGLLELHYHPESRALGGFWAPTTETGPGLRAGQSHCTWHTRCKVHLHSLACNCGNHGKSSQRACRSRLRARQGRCLATDTLSVCQVQWDRPALQPGPVSVVGAQNPPNALLSGW